MKYEKVFRVINVRDGENMGEREEKSRKERQITANTPVRLYKEMGRRMRKGAGKELIEGRSRG